MASETTEKALVVAQGQREDRMVGETEADDNGELENSLALDIVNSAIPFFVERLEAATNIPEERKEDVLMLYTGPSRLLRESVGEILELVGAALLWHPPYAPKTRLPGQPAIMPGYYFLGLLAIDEHGEYQCYRTSSGGVLTHMAYKLRKDGWFLWEQPKKYRVKQSANNAISLQAVEKPVAHKSK